MSFFCAAGYGQTKDDIHVASQLAIVPVAAAKTGQVPPVSGENLINKASTAAIQFYKAYISSQDGDNCTFYPSCSIYALQSVRKKGFFVGLLNAFDRLTRCNGLSNNKYPLKKGTHLLYDPVD